MGISINHFSNVIALAQAFFVIVYATATSFTGNLSVAPAPAPTETSDPLTVTLSLLLVLVAFGLVAATKKEYSASALGYTLLYVLLVIQWSPLITGFWDNGKLTRLLKDYKWQPIPISYGSLNQSIVMAFSALIGWGASAGRMSAAQGFSYTFFHVFFGTAFFKILDEMQVLDGGSNLALFGAAFGLGASLLLKNKGKTEGVSTPGLDFSAPKGQNVALTVLGALFFFVSFPALNSALTTNMIYRAQPGAIGNAAVAPAIAAASGRAFYNTIYGMASGLMTAYAVSAAFNNGKFSVQATVGSIIASGVSVAASGAYIKNVYGAMLQCICVVALYVFALHFNWAGKLKLKDSMQVFATYLLPALFGVIAAASAAARALAMDDYSVISRSVLVFGDRTAVMQGGYLIAAAIIAIVYGLVFGAVIGFLLNLRIFVVKSEDDLNDAAEWVEQEQIKKPLTAAPAAAAVAAPAAAAAAPKVPETAGAAPVVA